MTILEYLLKVLERERCIISLRALSLDVGFSYRYMWSCAHRAAREYPNQVTISRIPDQQGRPLCIRWIGD